MNSTDIKDISDSLRKAGNEVNRLSVAIHREMNPSLARLKLQSRTFNALIAAQGPVEGRRSWIAYVRMCKWHLASLRTQLKYARKVRSRYAAMLKYARLTQQMMRAS